MLGRFLNGSHGQDRKTTGEWRRHVDRYLLLNLRGPRDCGSCRHAVVPSCRSHLWYFLSPLDGASVREAHCAQASIYRLILQYETCVSLAVNATCLEYELQCDIHNNNNNNNNNSNNNNNGRNGSFLRGWLPHRGKAQMACNYCFPTRTMF